MESGESSPPPKMQPARLVRDIATIALVADMMAAGHHKHEIKAAVADRCVTAVSPRTIERLLSDARELIKVSAKTTKADMAAEALAFYRSVKADRTAPHRDRIKAQERIDELLGLSAKYASEAEKTDTAAEFARKAHEAMQQMLGSDLGGDITASEAKHKE